MNSNSTWFAALHDSLVSYRRMIDATVDQLTDAELMARPASGFNSVANILRHLGGNLRSRWSDFLTTDGEKEDRQRDTEFEDWAGDRESLLEFFNAGWQKLESAFDLIDETNIEQIIYVRGEPHTIPQALERAITHIAYHTGQITMVGRMVHQGDWKWLTIAPGTSGEFNKKTWGTSASQGVLASEAGRGSDHDAL
ncbi:MAG: DinB family protein [Planctomycetota bacterium]